MSGRQKKYFTNIISQIHNYNFTNSQLYFVKCYGAIIMNSTCIIYVIVITWAKGISQMYIPKPEGHYGVPEDKQDQLLTIMFHQAVYLIVSCSQTAIFSFYIWSAKK